MITLSKKDTRNIKMGRNVRTTYRKVGGLDVGGSCPSACPLLQTKACYAMNFHVDLIAKKSTPEEEDGPALVAWIKDLPKNTKVRHHVSGDVMEHIKGENGEAIERVDTKYLESMLEGHRQRPDVVGWSYTHAHRLLESSAVNAVDNLVVNASCDTHEELALALERGWPCTLTVNAAAEDDVLVLNGERVRIRICPAQTNDGMVCSACMMCAKKDRSQVIAFRMHGSRKNYMHQRGPQF